MTDTPRTDAEELKIHGGMLPNGSDGVTAEEDCCARMIRLARTLERELASARVERSPACPVTGAACDRPQHCQGLCIKQGGGEFVTMPNGERMLALDPQPFGEDAGLADEPPVVDIQPFGICVYCGMETTSKTADEAAAEVIDHHKVCPANPYREALRFYAKLDNWNPDINSTASAVDLDRGRTAIAALSGDPPKMKRLEEK